jgi:hypothetical protein
MSDGRTKVTLQACNLPFQELRLSQSRTRRQYLNYVTPIMEVGIPLFLKDSRHTGDLVLVA